MAPLAALTVFLGGFCFCACGRAIISECIASAANSLANMGEMASHALCGCTARHQPTQVA